MTCTSTTASAVLMRGGFDKALDALHEGDTLIVTTLDRLGRSTSNMLDLADELRARNVNLRVMNLGGRRPIFSDSQIANARRPIEQGQPASHVARDLGMSRATLYRRNANLDAQQWIASYPAAEDVRKGHTTVRPTREGYLLHTDECHARVSTNEQSVSVSESLTAGAAAAGGAV